MADQANSPRPRTSPFRLSLREVLLLVSFFAVACVALKYANEWWWLALSSCVLLGFLTAVVAALVDRGSRQAAAIGFAVCVGIYGILFWAGPTISGTQQSRELDPYSGQLPTTRIMQPLFEAIVTHAFYDMNTGQVIANYDVRRSEAPGVVGSRESPDRGQFMAISHLLWALLLGYFGAGVASVFYARRNQEQHAT